MPVTPPEANARSAQRRKEGLFRLVLAAVSLAVVVAVPSCADDDDEEAGVNVPPTTSFAEGLEELLETSPGNIADDINAIGIANLSPAEVVSTSAALCESAYRPQVVIELIQTSASAPSAMLIGPADRLLLHASRNCSRGPTELEEAAYHEGVTAYLAPQLTIPDEATSVVPDSVSKSVCNTLSHPAAGDVIGNVLSGLVELASRGRIDTGEFMPLVVEVAGSTCDEWFPLAVDAYQRHLDPEG